MAEEQLARTPLYELHKSLGAKLTPFAGYEMPVQYPAGIIAEHLHTRAKAGAVRRLAYGPGRAQRRRHRRAALEAAGARRYQRPAPGRCATRMLLNDAGGILDDLMVTQGWRGAVLVVNAARKEDDLAHMRARLGDGDRRTAFRPRAARTAGAGRGRGAGAASRGGVERDAVHASAPCRRLPASPASSRAPAIPARTVSRFPWPATHAETLARALLAEPEVAPIGLGARDTLRLEAGLCLYGHDIDETTTPVEADLAWTIAKRRREEGGFPGADAIQRELARRRVAPPRRHPARWPRAGARRHGDRRHRRRQRSARSPAAASARRSKAPVAMGYVDPRHSPRRAPSFALIVRGATRPARVAALPFVPHRYSPHPA